MDSMKTSVFGVTDEATTYIKKTSKDCPSCKQEKKFKLHVKSDIDGSAEIECPNCFYTENIPSNYLK